MRILALALIATAAAGCQREFLATNTWYDTAEIVCQRPNCPDCRGTTGRRCEPCKGTGGVKCDACKDGKQKCGTCKGDGRKDGKTCKTCDGSGRSVCFRCGGDMVMDHDRCSGKGQICCLQRIRINEPGIVNEEDAWPPGSFQGKK